MLKVTNLIYQYEQNNTKDIYDFSFFVKQGEIVGIVGESGSGKSTLLDLISGFLTPKSGTIYLDNNDLTNTPSEKRPMTILFQNYNTFEHLSVEKNVLLGINNAFRFKNEDKLKAKKILKEVGLEGFEKKTVSTLSGGQQQRVALARSLLRKAPILLLDEPFTGLDFETKVDMLKLVRKITNTKNLCTVMVTHDLNDCDLIAERVYKVINKKLTLL